MAPLLITLFVATTSMATVVKADGMVRTREQHKSEMLETAKCVDKYHPAEAELYRRLAEDMELDIEYTTQTEVCLVNGPNIVSCLIIAEYNEDVEECF